MSTALDYLSADYQRCALVVIDFQNDCILLDAPFAVKGSMEVLPALSTLCQGMRDAGRPVIHIVRGYLADGSNANLCRRDAIEKGSCSSVRKPKGMIFRVRLNRKTHCLLIGKCS